MGSLDEDLPEALRMEIVGERRDKFPMLSQMMGLAEEDDPAASETLHHLIGNGRPIEDDSVTLDDRAEFIGAHVGTG
jgi:hypothetical protein